MVDTDVLQTTLAGADAAVYAYGLIGAALTGTQRQQAIDAMAAHRTDRDRLQTLLVAAAVTPAAAAPAYALPFPVVDAASGRRLAGLVEDRAAGQLAAAAAALTGPDRSWAATSAQACAVRVVAWTGRAPVWSGAT